jgi:amino acid adenylation domain-containing protein
MDEAGRLCQSIAFRLHVGADRHRLSDNLARAVGSAAGGRLWVEEVPAGAEDPVAVRGRDRELGRSVDPGDGPPLRAVLLCYADGLADLVVVAHRTLGDRERLERLVRATLLGGQVGSIASGADLGALADALRGIDRAPAPAWGLGDGSVGEIGQHPTEVSVPAEGKVPDFVAALGLVLCRYSRERHVVVGTFEPLAAIPLRPSPESTVGSYLRSVRDLLARRRDRTAESPVVGVVTSPPLKRVVAEDIEAEPLEYRPFLAPVYPMSIHVEDDGGGALRARILYRAGRFDPEIAAQFALHLSIACRNLTTADPDALLREIDVLDDAERRRIASLGGVGLPFDRPSDRIHDVVARHVAETPDAVAVRFRDEQLTYRELDERANRSAHVLRALGIRTGARVGVCLDRSLDLVVVLLAVLKAGGVYVPMEPAYPSDRLAYTVRDAGLSIVVTAAEGFPADAGARVLHPKDLLSLGEDAPATSLAEETDPDDPAYLIYTSGSTGRPKAVVVSHRNVLSLLAATRGDLALGPADRWTLFHSSAFDFSVWEIWGCLMTGGRLVVVPYWVSRCPEEFRDLVAVEGVTVLNQTPSAFMQLMEVDRDRPIPRSLRLIILGGEPLDTGPLRSWFDRHPESECRLVNMFGITETTVHVTAQTVTRREALANSRSVGYPLPGWHVYVMDEGGRLLPSGVAGEIYVGGAGVAHQYLNRPELTAERFLPDPHAGGRMYRSGDRGRLLPNGRLEHLGRLDNQVKLRGHRIELNEIRKRLLDDPTVAAAAVVLAHAVPRDPASARLDAYVVLSGEGNPADVRRRAARFLPDYMVPTTVTALAALPLTPNGKLDVARLPVPSRAAESPTREGADGSPGADASVEDTVRNVWESVFGVRVGLDDDFFTLGGNSLLAVRLVAAMRERGLPTFVLRDLYLNPTVGEQAGFLRDAAASRRDTSKQTTK